MTKAERKLQDRLNRIAKLTPGKQRIYALDRIAEELRIEADVRDEHDRPTDEIDALLTVLSHIGDKGQEPPPNPRKN